MRQVQPDTEFVIFTDPGNHESFADWERECLDPGAKYVLFGGIEAQLDRAARKRNVDLLFSPMASAPAKTSVPLVVFALGLQAWEPESLRERRGGAASWKAVKRICNNAAAIVAPSEFLQRHFLELLDIPLNHVIVAPLGVSEVFSKPYDCALQKPFLLAVGCTHSFKNIPRLREVFDHLRDEIPHSLVVVGGVGDAEPSDWGPRVMRVEYCPATYLAGLYQNCDAYVQPSMREGSGVTVLEAMRAGAPVAASRTGGIAEVANDIPIFFNPESTASILAAIRRAIEEEPQQRQNRMKFGRQVAAEYTWERCAWKTLSAFKRV
jgi:alpha-1,3-rhamnosyl/mannosyltransferase